MPGPAPELIDTGNGLTLRFRGRFLYSPADPVGSLERRIAQQSFRSHTLYVLPSPLLFYGSESLLRLVDRTSHVLCIETDQQLMAFSFRYFSDRLRREERISYIRSGTVEGVLGFLQELNPRRFRRAVFLPLTGGYALDPQRYTGIFEAVKKEISRSWQDTMTRAHMGRLWMRNIFRNIALSPGRCASLPYTDKPVVTAGAGESLERSLEFLGENRRFFYLLAADTAYPVLLSRGIVPDAVCAVEAQHANIYDFMPPPAFPGTSGGGPLLLCDLSSHPGAVRAFRKNAHTGEIRFFYSTFAELSVLGRIESAGLLPVPVPPLGSIGITALYLASRITEGPILFTGLDFAYRPGKTHARGAPSHTAMLCGAGRTSGHTQYALSASRPWISLPSKRTPELSGAGEVKTDYVLSSYAAGMGELISKDSRFVDIGGIGAPHSGRVVVRHRDVKALLESASPGGDASGGKSGPSVHTAPSAEKRAARFIRSERDLLKKVMDRGRRFLTRDQGTESAAALREIFAAADYLYFHFPDPPPLPLTDPGFVKRVLLSAEEYRYRLSRLNPHSS